MAALPTIPWVPPKTARSSTSTAMTWVTTDSGRYTQRPKRTERTARTAASSASTTMTVLNDRKAQLQDELFRVARKLERCEEKKSLNSRLKKHSDGTRGFAKEYDTALEERFTTENRAQYTEQSKRVAQVLNDATLGGTRKAHK